MPIVEVDEEYKITLERIKDKFGIKPRDRLMLQVESEGKVVIEKVKQRDSLMEALENPAHITQDKMKLDLNKLEQEMWIG